MSERERVDILVKLKDQLSKPAEVIIQQIDRIRDHALEADVAVGKLNRRVNSLNKANGKAIASENQLDSVRKKHTKSIITQTDSYTKLNKASKSFTGRAHRDTDKVTNSIRKATNETKKFWKFSKLFKPMLILSVIGLIANAIQLLSAAVVGLGVAAFAGVSALAPLTGLLVAYPGYLSAIMQGMAVFKFVSHGLGDAIKTLLTPGASPADLAKTLGRLGPQGQKFARAVAGLRPQMMKLGRDIQEGILPSATKFVDFLKTDGLQIFGKGLRGAIKPISWVINKFTAFMKTAKAQHDITKMMNNNNAILGSFGKAGVGIFHSLLSILVAAGPMLRLMAKNTAQMFDNLAKWTDKNGKGMEKFFNNSYATAQKVGHYLSTIGKGFFNLGKLSLPLAHRLGTSMQASADRFLKKTQDPKQQKKIQIFFKKMEPIIRETTGLLWDIVKAIGELAVDPNFVKTVQVMRTDLLPAILKFIKSLNSATFIKSFARLLTSITKFLTDTNLFGVVSSFFDKLSWVIDRVTNAFNLLPSGLKKVISEVALFYLVYKKFGIVNKTFGLIGKGLGFGGKNKNGVINAGCCGTGLPGVGGKTGKPPIFTPLTKTALSTVIRALPMALLTTAAITTTGLALKTYHDNKIAKAESALTPFLPGTFEYNSSRALNRPNGLLGAPFSPIPTTSMSEAKPTAQFLHSSGDLPSTKPFNMFSLTNPLPVNIVSLPKGTGKFAGGSVSSGSTHLVNEIGAEGFLSKTGKLSMLGSGQQQFMNFKESGTVIPAHLMDTIKTGNKQTVSVSASNQGLTVHIGSITVQQANEFDVVNAVKKGIKDAQRELQERR